MTTTPPDERGRGDQSSERGAELVTDLAAPMAIRVAATLRLADLMADGPVDVADLAERAGADPDTLARLLRFLVSRGVFAELRPGVFTVNEAAAPLRSDHPSGMVNWVDLDGVGRVGLAFTGLLHTVRTGEPAFEQVFGAPFWEYLAANPAVGAAFDRAMADVDYKTDAAAGYDWTGVRHVVDVGGGVGALLAEVLRGHPDVRGTLVDLPAPVDRAREYLTAHGLDGRCDLVAQSFFDPLPPGGDVYVLSGILADWPDEQGVAILRRCAEAMDNSGRLLVIEHPSDDDRERTQMDLLMLVLLGGRNRTPADNTALTTAAGLRVVTTRTTPLGQIIIECVPAGDRARRH